ncbi:AGL003Wp [Eremothecium gossypii ATCC 10895]|uniref:AGL003Wp n=1 Tax=Eremothecium gossypii (strain ATCC 10895 / CBS 109.51 / FGSC 9923 / NRRL Y-1056) TaxID=284811 RepID=Q750F7_EREGS|nr:AGL003Wp [Eremothecium gossypii ATCC 10895]AAS54487.2 AGL003Wp [Eremothecium gossypii ATCC 10895]AEY98819.1 FAGL003Wp [Eremothecium gossypii FDAG1]
MSFLSRMLKLGKATATVGECEYTKWSKEQLIERLLLLEGEGKRSADTSVASEDPKRKKTNENAKKVKTKTPKEFDFSKYNTRFIALKFAYLGWNYNGLAIQKDPTPLPTVEGTILEAMNKCRMVPSMVPQDYKFSRCGRTDKGVSAMNQVISLRVRSNLTPQEQEDPANDAREIPYIHILNQLLPDDIRISAICLRPPKGFDARFSCKYRHYKYLFNKSGLDLSKMEEAARLYEGEHDFRNFCKLDGSKQITNFKRTILSAKILHVDGDMYCFDLLGSAFLWHQVRCMMANLFIVGQGLEPLTLINNLLDVEKNPQKPVYDMASDIPLILYDCKFDDMEWQLPDLSAEKAFKTTRSVDGIYLDYQLKAAVSTIFKNTLPRADKNEKITINVGDGKGKVVNVYQKLFDRQFSESVEAVNAKYKERKRKNTKGQ